MKYKLPDPRNTAKRSHLIKLWQHISWALINSLLPSIVLSTFFQVSHPLSIQLCTKWSWFTLLGHWQFLNDFHQWFFFLPHDSVIHTLLAHIKVKTLLFCSLLQYCHIHFHPWPHPRTSALRFCSINYFESSGFPFPLELSLSSENMLVTCKKWCAHSFKSWPSSLLIVDSNFSLKKTKFEQFWQNNSHSPHPFYNEILYLQVCFSISLAFPPSINS